MRTIPDALERSFEALEKRVLPNGGFAPDARLAGPARPDATAWAILALRAVGTDEEALEPSRSWLAGRQLSDGRVCLTRDHREVVWPTPLAALETAEATWGAHRYTRADFTELATITDAMPSEEIARRHRAIEF